MMFCKHVLGSQQGFTPVEIRLNRNEHKTPEYTKINPVQQIPAILETDSDGISHPFVLSESQAIMRYLMNTRFAGDSSPHDHLYPSKDMQARAKVEEYLDWNHVGLRLVTNRYAKLFYFNKVRGIPEDVEAQNQAREALS